MVRDSWFYLGYHRILNTRLEQQGYYDAFTKPILNALRFEDNEVMPETPQDAWDKVNTIDYRL